MWKEQDKGSSPTTVNHYRVHIVAFCNWAVQYDRLPNNPLQGLQKAATNGDIRHQRRALTRDEVSRLLKVAKLRPVADFCRETIRLKGKRKDGRPNWKRGKLTKENLEECFKRGLVKLGRSGAKRFIRTGRQRELAYRVMLSTGLRKSELGALTVDMLHSDRD